MHVIDNAVGEARLLPYPNPTRLTLCVSGAPPAHKGAPPAHKGAAHGASRRALQLPTEGVYSRDMGRGNSREGAAAASAAGAQVRETAEKRSMGDLSGDEGPLFAGSFRGGPAQTGMAAASLDPAIAAALDAMECMGRLPPPEIPAGRALRPRATAPSLRSQEAEGARPCEGGRARAKRPGVPPACAQSLGQLDRGAPPPSRPSY